MNRVQRLKTWGVTQRLGVTLVELLVVLSILALLAAIVVPAVVRSRAAARRLQCQNNLHQLAIAMISSADLHRRLPASGNIGIDSTGQFAPFHSWLVNLLPHLDQQPLHDRWQYDTPSNVSPNLELAGTQLSVLVCPDDISGVGRGDLSYVVNGGFGWTSLSPAGVPDCPVDPHQRPLDLNGNSITCPPQPGHDGTPSDKDLLLQTSLFFPENWKVRNGTRRFHRLDDVSDGLSQTILLSENVRTGAQPGKPSTNWANPYSQFTSFCVSFRVCRSNSCTPLNVDYSRANSGLESINSGLELAEGEAPWPNSFHEGGVHVAFADGRVKLIMEKISGRVYAALVSPQGSRVQGPLAQQAVSDADY